MKYKYILITLLVGILAAALYHIMAAPDVVGAMFLDTDESANGSLMMYGNGAWRKVADL